MLFSENQSLSTFCNEQEGSECSWIPKSLPDKHFDQSEEVRWGLNRQFVHLRQQRKWGGKCSLARSQLYKRGCHKQYWKHYRTNNYFEWLMCWVECFCNKLVFSLQFCVFLRFYPLSICLFFKFLPPSPQRTYISQIYSSMFDAGPVLWGLTKQSWDINTSLQKKN